MSVFVSLCVHMCVFVWCVCVRVYVCACVVCVFAYEKYFSPFKDKHTLFRLASI